MKNKIRKSRPQLAPLMQLKSSKKRKRRTKTVMLMELHVITITRRATMQIFAPS